MTKKKLVIVIGVFLVLIGAIALILSQQKRIVGHYVRMNRNKLEQTVQELIDSGESGKTIKRGGWQATYYKEAGMVEFIVYTFGIAPSSVYKGFYYSEDDLLRGFQGTDMEFVQDGVGFSWHEADGDNREYTEKITDHWYWFEVHF